MVAFITSPIDTLLQGATRARAPSRTCTAVPTLPCKPNSRCDLRETKLAPNTRWGSRSRDPIGYRGGSPSQYQFLGGHALNRLDPHGLRTIKEVCQDAVSDFLTGHQAEWDKHCGKQKYRYPFKLNIECKYNTEDKTCKDLKSTGHSSCIDEYWYGDTEVITICLSTYGFDKNELEQTIKENITRTLRHEFVHALDSCTCNSNCSQRKTPPPEEKEGFKKACEVRACTEIRAWSYINCRAVGAHDFDLCVLNGASSNMGNCDKSLWMTSSKHV